MSEADETDQSARRAPGRTRALILVAVIAAAAAILLTVKAQRTSDAVDAGSPTTGEASSASGNTPTRTRNDAVADYEAALKSGKPIYVLFHSLT